MQPLRTTLISSLVAALSLISAGGYGIRPCRYFWPESGTPLEETIFSAALGLGFICLLMILAGVLNAWTRSGAWIILIGGLALSPPFIKTASSLIPDRTFRGGPLLIVIALCAVWGFLLALAPITYYDSLVYHFALPAAYVQAHHWISLKELIYPAFPQNLEMLWTFGLLLHNDTVANLISFTLTILTIAGTGAFAVRYLTHQESRMAVLLLSTMPAFLLLSSGGYVDNGLTLYVFLSFYALCRWRETGRRSALLLSGLLGGLAMGTKYTGGIPFAAGGVLLLWYERRQPVLAIKNFTLYGSAGALILSPWLIKNTVYVGNPFFPFFYGLGNPKMSPWVQGAAAGYFRGLAEYEPRTLANLLRLPWDIAFRSLRFGGGMDVLGDYGWAPFVVLVPCLAFCRKMSPITRFLLAYAALFFIPWAFTRPVLRFLLPLAPVLALLSATAWKAITDKGSRSLQWLGKGVLTALLVVDFGFFFLVEGIIQPFPVALGLESRDHYLDRKLNYFAASQFINQLPEASHVLVLGDQRGYYYEKPVIVTPVFNQNPMTVWANEASSPEDLATRLRMQHISHFLINGTEWKRLDGAYHLFPFTAQGLANWNGLLSGPAKSVYRDPNCEVFAL